MGTGSSYISRGAIPVPQRGLSLNPTRAEVAKIVEDFMSAVEKVVEITGRTTLTPRSKAATITEHARIDGDAAGSVSFQGDYSGEFLIAFSKAAICEITGNMLFAPGQYTNHRDTDVEGAIGELTNQISGHARMKISGRTGWKAVNGVPSVIVGENISRTINSSGTMVAHMPYSTTQMNELYFEVVISNHPAGERNI